MDRVEELILLENADKRITEFIFAPEAGLNIHEELIRFSNFVQRSAEDGNNAHNIFTDVRSPFHMVLIEDLT